MSTKIFCLAFAVMFASVAVADDEPAKKKRRATNPRNNMVTAVMKQLEKAELTDEQKTKIQELAKKSMAQLKEARQAAGITPELMKKRAAAMKELRETGEKKKLVELTAEANKKAGVTEQQAEVFKKSNAARAALIKSAVALLSDEQKEKLPKQLLRGRNAGQQAKGKRAKKKEAAGQ